MSLFSDYLVRFQTDIAMMPQVDYYVQNELFHPGLIFPQQ